MGCGQMANQRWRKKEKYFSIFKPDILNMRSQWIKPE